MRTVIAMGADIDDERSRRHVNLVGTEQEHHIQSTGFGHGRRIQPALSGGKSDLQRPDPRSGGVQHAIAVPVFLDCSKLDRGLGHKRSNRGTIGGSLCHLDPSAEIPTIALALDATVTAAGPSGKRDIKIADFPVDYMTTAVQPDEILTEIRFPAWPKGHGYGFVEFARRHGDFAIASAAALLEEDANGKIKRVSLTIGGVSKTPVRMPNVEKALLGQTASEDVFRDACEECRKLEALADVHAPANYRQHLATVMSRRALMAAHNRVGGRA